VVSVLARRKQVAYAKQRILFKGRMSTLLCVARSSLHYESVQAVQDSLAPAGTEILSVHAVPRYGYRRVQIFLDSHGRKMNTTSNLNFSVVILAAHKHLLVALNLKLKGV
jgi:hypothetical protein